MPKGGKGVFSWLFGKKSSSRSRGKSTASRERSAELRRTRRASLPGTKENIERYKNRRNPDLASEEVRRKRLAIIHGTRKSRK